MQFSCSILTRRGGIAVSAFSATHQPRTRTTCSIPRFLRHSNWRHQRRRHSFVRSSNRHASFHAPSSLLFARTSIFGDDDAEAQLLVGLNENQIAAVTQPHHSIVRVIAGPGSGKTRVLTSRIAWLLLTTSGRTNDHILGVTFTKKASGEMQRRLESMVVDDPAVRRVTLGTFHSVCAKILRFNGELLETLPSVQEEMYRSLNATLLDGGFTIIDQAEKERKVKEALKLRKIDLKKYHYNGNEIPLKNVVSALASSKQAFAENRDPFKSSKKDPLSPLMQVTQKIYYDYRQMLLSTNCLDFDDLILLARELLQQHRSVQERLQSYWTHVLVDEYQDTSRVQMDVIQLLAKSSLFVVGDADQSIYSWRGAHAGSLSTFDQEFGHKHVNGVRTVYLMENYRSTSNIVRAAQKVIAKSGNVSGENQLRQKMIPQREKGAAPKIIACEDGSTEANFVVDKVKANMQKGIYGPDSSIAMIYRTNAQSRELEECCVRSGIAYVIFGAATAFYKRQEVKDCLCFARWLYNGWDREAMLRAMVTPRKGLGETAVRDFEGYCSMVQGQWANYEETNSIGGNRPTPLDILCFVGGDPSWISMPSDEIPPPGMTIGARFVRPLKEFGQQMVQIRRQAETATVDELLEFVVKQVGLMAHLEKLSKTNDEFSDRKGNVMELLQASRRYSEDGPSLGDARNATNGDDMFSQSPLANFLDDVSLVTEVADENANPDAEKRLVVNLMTIHASKGMEFDTAFVVGLEEGTIPTHQAKEEGEDTVKFNEERRLLYVAMTRAKSELFMSWRKEVPVFTKEGIKYMKKRRSQFLDDLTSKKSNGTERKDTSKPQQKGTSKRSYAAQGGSNSRPRGLPPANRPPPRPERRNQPTASWPARSIAPSRANSRGALPLATRGPTSGAAASTIPRGNPPRHALRAAAQPRATTPLRTQTRPASTQKPVVTKLKPIQPDASWFFPTGSKVRHTKLGVGIVVPAAQPSQQHVHVKFSNGQTKKFPVSGRELSPVS